MNTIVMFMLVIVIVTVKPGEEPKVHHNAPPLYFRQDACISDAKTKALAAVEAWVAEHADTIAVIASRVDCIPVTVPFAGKSA